MRHTSSDTTRTHSTTLDMGTCEGAGYSPSSCVPTAVPSFISDDEDDFYDAQDAETLGFDVILPTSTAEKSDTAIDTLSPNYSGQLPAGADLAMEYESDIGDSDIDEDTDGTKGQAKVYGKQARVIQKHTWGKTVCVYFLNWFFSKTRMVSNEYSCIILVTLG